MLFDEKDFNIFDNNDSKLYFKEILQTYYSQNYRASVVLLYSFVMYDLYNKIQQMANEGDKKAQTKLKELNTMIKDEEKYSKVEANIISFFNENCSLYFNRFTEDIEYLRICRNKSAHLKVDDNSLFIPKDYQVRMLICSMYDNILSVKAPFIMDLFSIVQTDIEIYTSQLHSISYKGLDDEQIRDLSNKYYSRMTYDSLKKSYKTFLKLLLKSEDEIASSNTCGLYVFVFSMTKYVIDNGYSQLFDEPDIEYFLKLDLQSLKNNKIKKDVLITLMINFSVIMDKIRSVSEIFTFISDEVLNDPKHLVLYRVFYPRTTETVFDYFKKHAKVQRCSYIDVLYNSLKDVDNFDFDEFMILMIDAVPEYWGFNAADCYASFFIEYLSKMNENTIKEIITKYKSNNQCYGRSRHGDDAKQINEELRKMNIDIYL